MTVPLKYKTLNECKNFFAICVSIILLYLYGNGLYQIALKFIHTFTQKEGTVVF